MSEAKTIEYEIAVNEVRKACRQFAMLYFHFAKTLKEEVGQEKAKELVQKAIFELSLDRTDQLKEKAKEQELDFSRESFRKVSDLPWIGWDKSLGRNHCPYAETWVKYYEKNPWFEELAPFYCDIIDTTNIENFSGTLSHKITKNVLKGDETCDRIYFPSKEVEEGKLTYGTRTEKQE